MCKNGECGTFTGDEPDDTAGRAIKAMPTAQLVGVFAVGRTDVLKRGADKPQTLDEAIDLVTSVELLTEIVDELRSRGVHLQVTEL